jgi:hypothetical protein
MENELEEALIEYQEPAKRKHLMEILLGLQSNNGWLFLSEFLTNNATELTEVVLDPPDGMKADEVDRLRDKIKLQRNLVKLPDEIIKALNTSSTQIDTNLDPYN